MGSKRGKKGKGKGRERRWKDVFGPLCPMALQSLNPAMNPLALSPIDPELESLF